jgi:DNA end-binding protein Ku
MPARALGSATISFGLVSIPVKLYSAADSAATIHFNQIDRRDGARVKQQLISANSGEVVPRDEIVKGYEFAKGQYVLFTPEEIKALEVAATYLIDIDQFLPDGTVDRIYFDKAYYLGPDKGGARAYHLLAEALRATGRIAIGRYAARGRQHLVLVRPKENGLLLEQLHYADEVRAFSEVPLDVVEVKEAELALAKQLIDQAASDTFEPTNYRDEVREQIMALIQRKVDGEDISVAPTEKPEHKIIDIMEALKASLDATGKRKPAKAADAKRAARSTSAKATSAKPASAKATSEQKTARKKRAG